MDPTQQNDPLAAYQQFRSQLLQRYGMQDNSQQVSGPALSGSTQRDRIQQQAGRGTAPATVGNIAGAMGNAANLMGGMGALTTGLGSMAELGTGQAPGSLGGLNMMQGFRAIPVEKRRLLNNLVDYHEAANAAQGGGIGSAGDSHGQVSGGGTGSKGGGLTQGGPR